VLATSPHLTYIAKKAALPNYRQRATRGRLVQEARSSSIRPNTLAALVECDQFDDPSYRGSDARRGHRSITGSIDRKFGVHGAICIREHGSETFNFQQRWTLVAGVSMATSSRDSLATATLALNLLDQYFRGKADRVFRAPDPRSLRFMPAFAREMLAPLADSSWHLPLDSIHEWHQARRAPRRALRLAKAPLR